MTRIELFEDAAAACRRLGEQYPGDPDIKSILNQLDYLVSLETGTNTDRSSLKRITIGVLAAKVIEPMSREIAERLHRVSAEVRWM